MIHAMSLPISGPRKASYVLFLLALLGVARWGLGACVLAALVSYMMMDLTERRMRDRGARPRTARLAALAVFAILATLLTWIFVAFVRVGVKARFVQCQLEELDGLGAVLSQCFKRTVELILTVVERHVHGQFFHAAQASTSKTRQAPAMFNQ